MAHKLSTDCESSMQIALSKEANGFIECSSKTGENVIKIFDLLARLIFQNKQSSDS